MRSIPIFDIRLALKTITPAVVLFILMTACNASAAPMATVTEVRHWSNPSYTRVVINLNRQARFEHRLLKKDPSINVGWRRLYIDVKGSVMGRGLSRDVHINDGLLKKARSGQYDKDTVRVVLDIESIEDYKIFPLNDPFRIVIDVTGEKRAGTARVQLPEAKDGGMTLTQQLGLKVGRIVIDAGHGGKDPGAIGRRGLKEKDVTLKLALMLRDRLAARTDSNVILTRDRDVFIPLEERTAIANSKDADIFISLHINASPNRAATGVETYILSISNDEESKRVAARENATSTRSVSDLEFILSDLIKTAKTNDSMRLAESVQGSLVSTLRKKYTHTRSNGVKGAPFYVLIGTKMPSILVEVAFISNPDEERFLTDEGYLKEVVEGISAGVLGYINGPGAV